MLSYSLVPGTIGIATELRLTFNPKTETQQSLCTMATRNFSLRRGKNEGEGLVTSLCLSAAVVMKHVIALSLSVDNSKAFYVCGKGCLIGTVRHSKNTSSMGKKLPLFDMFIVFDGAGANNFRTDRGKANKGPYDPEVIGGATGKGSRLLDMYLTILSKETLSLWGL